jgi:LacI family transcriptional regulator
MVTIKDVAKAAGVSISTASYALNDSAKVSQETKLRIRRVAEELRYFPNGTAKNLKRKRTDTIGIILGDLTGPFYGELIGGIQDALGNSEYDLIICSNHGGRVSTAQKSLRERRVDGAVILSPFMESDFILDMSESRMPIVVLDRELKGKNVCSILIDNDKGAYLAVSHLISLGFRDVYYIGGPSIAYDESKRFTGYQRALKENGIRLDKSRLLKGDFTERSGYEAVKLLVARGEIPPALFCANDEMAIGAIRMLQEAGIRVPDQVSIVGFDDIRLSSYISPRLTTIGRPMFEMGILAAHVLLKAIAGEPMGGNVVLSVDLIVRESCKRREGGG